MGLVLIHIAPGGIPVGAWRAITRVSGTGESGDELQGYYPDEHAGLHANARAALGAKGAAVPWPVWFHRLTERSPYFDDYETIEALDGDDLAAVLARFTDGWNNGKRDAGNRA